MIQVDPLVAAVVAGMTSGARQRLDRFLRNASSRCVSATGYRAGSGELTVPGAVRGISVRIRRGSPVFTVEIGSSTWEQQRLTLHVPVPDTVLSAMRGRRLAEVLEHPLFEDAVVSSARRSEGAVIIETRRRPCVDLASIISTGDDRPADVVGTLRRLGVVSICRVAAAVIEKLPEAGRQTLLSRLEDAPEACVHDLFGYPPDGISSMRLHVRDGCLVSAAHLLNGIFTTGRLSMHGNYRSRARIFSSGLFWSYKVRMRKGNFARPPAEPTMTLEVFSEHMDREQRLRMAA